MVEVNGQAIHKTLAVEAAAAQALLILRLLHLNSAQLRLTQLPHLFLVEMEQLLMTHSDQMGLKGIIQHLLLAAGQQR